MRIRIGLFTFSGLALVLFSLIPSAQAGISTYSNLAAWQTDNPSTTLQDFNSVASGGYNPYTSTADGTIQTTYTYNSGGPYNAGVYTQSSPNLGSGQYLAAGTDSYTESGVNATSTEYYEYYDCYSFSGCGWYSGSYAPSGGGSFSYNQSASMVLTPPPGTTSLGFNVGQAYNYSTQSNISITATITTADLQTQTLTENNVYGTLSFFGFDASDPITSVVITEAVNPGVYTYTAAHNSQTYYYDDGYGPNSGYYWFAYSSSYSTIEESQLAFDNLMYGSSVPEPTSVLLLGSAVLAVVVVTRKRLLHRLDR